MGLFGKKSTPSSTGPAPMRNPVVVHGTGTSQGSPFAFEVTVEAEDVSSRHMVNQAAQKAYNLSPRTEILRWGRKDHQGGTYP